MICNHCGNELEDGEKFCTSCGKAVNTTSKEQDAMDLEDADEFESNYKEESILEKPAFLKKINMGHIGVLFGALMSMACAFLPNPKLQDSASLVDLLSYQTSEGSSDGVSFILILAAGLIFTLCMAFLNKGTLTAVGSALSMAWMVFMLFRAGESLLAARGLLLFFLGGALLIGMSILLLLLNLKKKECTITDLEKTG